MPPTRIARDESTAFLLVRETNGSLRAGSAATPGHGYGGRCRRVARDCGPAPENVCHFQSFGLANLAMPKRVPNAYRNAGPTTGILAGRTAYQGLGRRMSGVHGERGTGARWPACFCKVGRKSAAACLSRARRGSRSGPYTVCRCRIRVIDGDEPRRWFPTVLLRGALRNCDLGGGGRVPGSDVSRGMSCAVRSREVRDAFGRPESCRLCRDS
jgi:hypothetical protein